MFDVIERLKSEWTDKYVVVSSPAPELARFSRTTGIVKTVNMNGRCLVEFDQFNNTGWYDIDPACLKIVPKPEPKPAEAKEPKAAPAAKTPATPKPAGAEKPAGGKPSTADILAAARAKGGAAAAKPAGDDAAKATPSAKPSTAEILARARAAKAAPAAAPEAAEPPIESAPEAPIAKPAAAAKKPATEGARPTTTAEKLAWCRAHDAQG